MRGDQVNDKKSVFVLGIMVLGLMLSAGKCSDTKLLDSVDDANSDKADDGEAEGEETSSDVDDEEEQTIYTGVDLLVVIDNSASMAEEQELLMDGLFGLMASLAVVLPEEAAENVRVGMVTSDLGLQYGSHQVSAPDYPIDSCEDLYGDDGELVTQDRNDVTTIMIPSDIISCTDCPDGIVTEGDTTYVDCGVLEMPDDGILGKDSESFVEFAAQLACTSQVGVEGCGIEQQLKSAVRGLEGNPSFLVDDHLLGVLVVSDEEDCSIQSADLFTTEEWISGAADMLNVACNIDSNEQYLVDPAEYKEALVDLKGDEDAVIFGAIVGVPPENDCQGTGDNLGDCLDHADMQIELATFLTSDGFEYIHFKPACTRVEDDIVVTTARPGRRYVEVAQEFGENGIVASICNNDFSPLMEDLAQNLAARFN